MEPLHGGEGRKVRIADIIPAGFRCPICGEPRPNPHSWAITSRGFAACRACITRDRSLVVTPFAAPPAEDPKRDVYCLVVEGQVVRAPAGSCVLGCGEHTKRLEGYCSRCLYEMLRYEHGGIGAYRLDHHGVPFCVFSDEVWAQRELGSKELPREAYYPWGRELLPKKPSIASCEAEYNLVRDHMWAEVEPHLERATSIARWKLRQAYDEQAHDAAVEAACKAVIRYDPGRGCKFETFLERCVSRAAGRAYALEKRRRRRLISFEDAKVEAEAREDDGEADRLARLFGRVLDSDQILEALELTAFQRKLIRLYALDGLTLEQIGHRYGVVKTTVHRWIYLIRQRCKDRYNAILD